MRLFVASLLCATAVASVARAQAIAPIQEAAAPTPDVSSQISRLEALIADQASQLARQEKEIADQKAALQTQQGLLNNLKLSQSVMANERATGAPTIDVAALALAIPNPEALQAPAASPAQPVVPGGPVGEAPPPSDNRVTVAALPEGNGVLTPRGHWALEPSFVYTHGSDNRLVFRGVELTTGLLIGGLEASDVDQNLASGALDFRYGLTNHIELEARLPFVYRTDRVTVFTNDQTATTHTEVINGSGIGDAEFSVRYQLNSGQNGVPVMIAGLRAKSTTGSDPYSIGRDSFGISESAATGSGFWGLEPSLSFLYPSDPAVIFGSISYFDQLPRNINRTIGANFVGRVDPGGAINLSAGFGFALNPQFSFSLGYRDTYIFPTKTMFTGGASKNTSLQVGAFTFGWSFQLTPRISLSNTYEIGTTKDAPDMNIGLRLPIRF